EPSRCAPSTEPSTTGRTSRTRCSDSTAPRAVWRWVDSHPRRPLLVIPSSLLARRSPASTSTPTRGGTPAGDVRLELTVHPNLLGWRTTMAAASLQRMVSRHTRLTCGHGTRLLARSEAMVRSTRADHLHGYLTVAAAHHRGPDGHGRWSRRRSPGLVLDE